MGIHHIYNFSAAADKDELIRFWSQQVKDQGHSDYKISTFGGILSPISGMHGCLTYLYTIFDFIHHFINKKQVSIVYSKKYPLCICVSTYSVCH